jgi:secreted Zn-dependent insulinase-like peptidase
MQYLMIIGFCFAGFKERPDSQASTLLTYLMNEHSQLPGDMLALTEATTLSDFRQRLKEAFQYSHITTYSHGDVTADDALKMHSAVKDNIVSTVKSNGNDNNKDVLDKARLLPVREHAVLILPAFNSEDPNSALITHFQVSCIACLP